MRSFNPLILFVAAIALASSVTAIATPVRRGDSDEPPSGQTCNQGSLTCCQSASTLGAVLGGGLGVLAPILADLPVLSDCAVAGLGGCVNSQHCCSGIQNQYGLVNVGLNCIDAPVPIV
ncbi:hypothetical protein EI94DRAFT_958328 [Lactarius quietus]|nr:hypothetical protein EI94DRAFT_1142546 [Lactarius quietus]KAF8259881.1 hypothetical protein EI94DRAFT_958328 [Lactarius quietus]